jgi:DNA topoisomerase-3
MVLRFDENFKLKLEPKKIAAPTPKKKTKPVRSLPCPKCQGIVIKGRLWM